MNIWSVLFVVVCCVGCAWAILASRAKLLTVGLVIAAAVVGFFGPAVVLLIIRASAETQKATADLLAVPLCFGLPAATSLLHAWRTRKAQAITE